MMVPRTVVVGVDDSAQSRAAVRWAARYADLTGGSLRAVLVWDMPLQPGAPDRIMAMPPDVPIPDEMRDQAARRLIDVLVGALDADRAAQVDKQVVTGDPVAVLREQSTGSDVLVLGNSHHGALAGAVLGSVALRCLHHAECPVVLVPADAHES
jgi:nucleotide-binding universal stress UspA family protein